MVTAELIDEVRAAFVAADKACDEAERATPDLLADRERARLRLERLEVARGGSGPTPTGPMLREVIAQAEAAAARAGEAEAALPCGLARVKLAAAPNMLATLTASREGRQACREAGVVYDPRSTSACPFARAPWCPWEVYSGAMDTIRAHLTADRCRLAEDELGPLRAHFGFTSPRVPLEPHDGLRVVRRLLAGQTGRVPPSRPGVDSHGRPIVQLEREVEIPDEVRLLTLVGAAGLGKTLAGAFALAILGGMAIQSSEIDGLWRAAGQELRDRAMAARVLLVDQFGRAGTRENVEALLVERYRRGRRCLTIVVGNIDRPADLAAKVGPAAWDRLQSGLFVPLVGASLRRPAAQRVAS